MTKNIWRREENRYPGFPGQFVGSVVKTDEPSIGRFTVVAGKKVLFTFNCRLPKENAKAKKTFATDMSNLMDGVIELKS